MYTSSAQPSLGEAAIARHGISCASGGASCRKKRYSYLLRNIIIALPLQQPLSAPSEAVPPQHRHPAFSARKLLGHRSDPAAAV